MKKLVFSFCFLLLGCSNEPVFLKGHSESWQGEYILLNENSDLVLRYKGHRFEHIGKLEIEINDKRTLPFKTNNRVLWVEAEDWIKPEETPANILIIVRWNDKEEEIVLKTRY